MALYYDENNCNSENDFLKEFNDILTQCDLTIIEAQKGLHHNDSASDSAKEIVNCENNQKFTHGLNVDASYPVLTNSTTMFRAKSQLSKGLLVQRANNNTPLDLREHSKTASTQGISNKDTCKPIKKRNYQKKVITRASRVYGSPLIEYPNMPYQYHQQVPYQNYVPVSKQSVLGVYPHLANNSNRKRGGGSARNLVLPHTVNCYYPNMIFSNPELVQYHRRMAHHLYEMRHGNSENAYAQFYQDFKCCDILANPVYNSASTNKHVYGPSLM